MKAKYFRKIRKQVKWYKVSHRENTLYSFSNEKEVLAIPNGVRRKVKRYL